MRPLQQFEGAPVPLFDRLSDDAPGVRAEAEPRRVLDLDGLKESVGREIEILLNTRCPLKEEDIDYKTRSVIDYGLVDIAPYFTRSVDDRRRLSQHIARTIAVYEPRLTRVSVTIEDMSRETHRLLVRVDGAVRFGNVVHPVSFPVHVSQGDE